MWKKISSWWPILVLGLVVLLVWNANYVPGKYLTGWDNLHPEFDFKTNIIDRTLFGVWQEYQGLGVLAGNAHAADLLRQVALWVVSLFAPNNMIRYLYHFWAWASGGIGIYILCRKKLFAREEFGVTNAASLIAGLFYLLNLGTIQNFYLPYEAFSHHFAMLPWLIWRLLEYLDKPNWKNLRWWAFVNVLAVPMAYIPTVFVVYLLELTVILGIYFFSKINKERFVNSLKVGLVVILVNIFWLLPFVYFVSKGTDVVFSSTINRIFTEEAFLRNQGYGDLHEVAILKGFWFSNIDLVSISEASHDWLMKPWVDHFEKGFDGLYYVLSVGVFGGLLYALVRGKKWTGSMAFLMFLAMFALINDNPPTGVLFNFAQKYIPLFAQVLRLPFTKFVMLASFAYSIFLGWFAVGLSELVVKYKFFKYRFFYGVMIIIGSLIVFASWPVFEGDFVYSKMKVEIPNEYFEIFEYFQSQENNGRVANLPQPTFWGWVSYDWGYRGSGFPWYGIPQAIGDRAFDVWRTENEGYYRELSHAIYDENSSELFLSVLDKYGIEYVWIDPRVLSLHKPELVDTGKTESWLAESNMFELNFENGQQKVYKRKTDLGKVSAPEVYTTLNERSGILDAEDNLYVTNGDYVFKDDGAVYPFMDLGSQLKGTLTKSKGFLSGFLQTEVSSGKLIIPSHNSGLVELVAGSDEKLGVKWPDNSLLVDNAEVKTGGNISWYEVGSSKNFMFRGEDGFYTWNDLPVKIGTDRLSNLEVYKLDDEFVQDITYGLGSVDVYDCDLEHGQVSKNFDGRVLNLASQNTKACVYNRMNIMWPDMGKYADKGVVRTINFEVRSNTGGNVFLCLTHEGDEGCYYRGKLDVSANTGWRKVGFSVGEYVTDLEKVWVQLELQSGDERSNVDFRNLSLSVVGKPSYVTDLSEDSLENTNMNISGDGKLEYLINDDLIAKVDIFSSGDSDENCYYFGSGYGEKKIVGSGNNLHVRYKSYDGSSCESVRVDNVVGTDGLMLEVVSRNVSGRPAKVCLRHDSPGNCLVEEILSKGDGVGWVSDYFIVPPVETDGSYYFEVDNLAVGKEERINEIKSVNIYRLPWKFLKSIRLENAASKNLDLKTQNNLEVETIEKWGTSHYRAEVRSQKSGVSNNGLIVLGQGYEDGWNAYLMKAPNNKQQASNNFKSQMPNIQTLFPWWFGEELAQVKVNGWANGFQLSVVSDESNANRLPTTDSQQLEVVIVYWPQYLQWGGFGFLVIGSLFLVFWPRKKKHFYDPILDRIHHIKIPNINLLKKKLHLD